MGFDACHPSVRPPNSFLGPASLVRATVAVVDRSDIDVVFLDAGGVLLYPDWERISRILAKHGITATSAQLAEAEFPAKRRMDDAGFRSSTGDITEPDGYLGWVVKATGIDYDDEALHAAARDFQAEHVRANLWSVVPDEVHPALRRLRAAGYLLGLISNTEDNLRPVLARTGLDAYFDSLVLSSEVGSEKPEPAIFREALREMAVAPERAIFVGDFYSIDVAGARGVGITPILLDARGLSPDRDVTRVASLTELADLLGA
jgi:HAD superfamily hydrolase (TIGR01509 family)